MTAGGAGPHRKGRTSSSTCWNFLLFVHRKKKKKKIKKNIFLQVLSLNNYSSGVCASLSVLCWGHGGILPWIFFFFFSLEISIALWYLGARTVLALGGRVWTLGTTCSVARMLQKLFVLHLLLTAGAQESTNTPLIVAQIHQRSVN